MTKHIKTVISGSFRKHMDEIGKALESFVRAGAEVLAPTTKETINPKEEFIILASDNPDKSPRRLETDFMGKIGRADFLYVVDIDGYIGQSVAAEMAYARLKNLPIIVAEKIKIFSSEVPEESHELLRKSALRALKISEISKKKIAGLRQSFSNLDTQNLTGEERKVLHSLIEKLLKDLTK